jgi:N-dimethylarginine dimethylaminohydrolase
LSQTTKAFGGQSMIAPLRRALVHEPGAELSQEAWSAWGYEGTVPLDRLIEEHRGFVGLLASRGVELIETGPIPSIAAMSTYDSSLVTDAGAIIMRSGRPERRAESEPTRRVYERLGIPVIGAIVGAGEMDCGDVFWLDERTLVAGRSYRTNQAAIDQLRALVDGLVDEIHAFDLVHWDGPVEVFHAMSTVSPASNEVVLVYPRLTAVGLMKLLHERELTVVEVPGEEWPTEGANVLAVEPGVVIAVEGNPVTKARLEDAGIEVLTYPGPTMTIFWHSGPTCTCRPILRG